MHLPDWVIMKIKYAFKTDGGGALIPEAEWIYSHAGLHQTIHLP